MNSSIAMGVRGPEFENPVNQLARVMQVQGMQQQNVLAQAKMGEYQRGVERQNKLAALLQSTPEDQVEPALMRGGFMKEAMDFGKNKSDRAKAGADLRTSQLGAKEKEIELVGRTFGFLKDKPTPENAGFMLEFLEGQGLMPAQQVQQFKTLFAGNPDKIGLFAEQMFRQALSAKDQLAKTETRDAGGFVQTTATDPVSMKQTVIGQTAKTVSPDAQLSAETTRRGQNLTDARARERLAFDQQQPRGVLDPERGLLVDPRTGEARPVTMGGQPVGMKAPAEARKELMSINQQRAAISGAIQAAEKSPTAFGLWRGIAASLPGGETVAGRMETMDETQARAYVFNNVSRIINERAGAAQSAQELARLQQFLPGASDNQTQIVNKLKGFNKYLDDLERGTRTSTGGAAPAGNTGGASGSFGDDPLGLR